MAKKKNSHDFDDEDRRFIEEKMYGNTSDKFSSFSPVNYNFKCTFKAKNPLQKTFWNNLKSDSVVSICEGPAGTGKSYVALLYALKSYLDGRFNKINIIVPNVEASKNTIGILPGDLSQKLYNHELECRQTLEIVLEDSGNMNPKQIVEGLVRNGIIDFQPVSFLRGRNLRGLTIISECENFSTDELFLILTRISNSGIRNTEKEFESGKMVIIGDRTQTDRHDIRKDFHGRCGLVYAIEHLRGMKDVDIVEFTSDMVVRNPFIIKLIERWNKSVDEINDEISKQKNGHDKVNDDSDVTENPVELTDAPANELNIVEEPSKKKRGRPKKVKDEHIV